MDNNKRKIHAVREILPGILKDITRSDSQEQVQLETVWSDIAGMNAVGVKLGGVKDGTVHITVDSPARLYYWKIRRIAVLKRFQERRPDVKYVVFKIGKVT